MKWIARIYMHNKKYDIIINYADGKEYTLFNADGYKKLRELVKLNTGICLVTVNYLHFMRDNGMDMAVINAYNSKTKSCCVTVEEIKNGIFDWKKELQEMKDLYKVKPILEAHLSTFFGEYDERKENEKLMQAVMNYCYNEMQKVPLIVNSILNGKKWNWSFYFTQTLMIMLKKLFITENMEVV